MGRGWLTTWISTPVLIQCVAAVWPSVCHTTALGLAIPAPATWAL